MLVSCPQCKAKYQLAANIKNVIFVCHRCDTEFSIGQPKEEGMNDQGQSLVSELSLSPAKEPLPAVPLSEKMILPKRGKPRIWPWLMLVLLSISVLGIWKNQQQWLSQPWVRSVMMNMALPIKPSVDDWELVKKSLKSQWVDRQDGSRVLLVRGDIQNRLLSDQTPPRISVSFFDISHKHLIQTRSISIYEPPSLAEIQHAPYLPPAVDTVPVVGGGKRAFTLVLENVPEEYQEISMSIMVPS